MGNYIKHSIIYIYLCYSSTLSIKTSKPDKFSLRPTLFLEASNNSHFLDRQWANNSMVSSSSSSHMLRALAFWGLQLDYQLGSLVFQDRLLLSSISNNNSHMGSNTVSKNEAWEKLLYNIREQNSFEFIGCFSSILGNSLLMRRFIS